MLDDVTKKRINSLRQILVGKLPDPKAQVEQITNGLIAYIVQSTVTGQWCLEV